jgi:transposase
MASFGRLAAVGVEGTGSYGAGLTRVLSAVGLAVVEVDRPDRSASRSLGMTP